MQFCPLENLTFILTSPLETYKQKYNAKNWSDFANKKIIYGKTSSSMIQDSSKINDVATLIDPTGKFIDIIKERKPLTSRKLLDPITTNIGIEEDTSKAKTLTISQNHLELLESIGSFSKYRETYFPHDFNEIEYFVKISDPELYKKFYSYGIVTCPKIEQLINPDIINYGNSLLRNKINLTNREESILIKEWYFNLRFNLMKEKFCIKESQGIQIRRMQIILSFALNECKRQAKTECNQRAEVLNMIWINCIELFRIIETYINESNNKTEEEINNKLKNKFEEMNKKIVNLEKENETLKEKNSIIEKSIQDNLSNYDILIMRNRALDFRIDILSSIIDLFVNENLKELREICEEKKEGIIARLIELRKQKKIRLDMEDNNDLNDYDLELEKLIKYQFEKRNEIDNVLPEAESNLKKPSSVDIKELFKKIEKKIEHSG